jgi:hypothetical protein
MHDDIDAVIEPIVEAARIRVVDAETSCAASCGAILKTAV